MLIIPAIDIKNGQCVRLRQGDFDDSTVFSDKPVEMAEKWVQAGARRLHLVDLDGAVEGYPVNADVVKQICKAYPKLPVQIGGGIRDIASAEAYIEAGVQYVIIGTAAVKNPPLVTQLCQQFGGKIIVGLDARDGFVATEGWLEQSTVSALELAQGFANTGVSAIVYTDIARDGMMQGVNIEATQDLAKAISIPVIASGGVHNLDDIRALAKVADSGISGAITGRAIYEGTLDFAQAQALADELNSPK